MLFFEDPTIVELLKTRFVPVTMDINIRKAQNDAEGTFYRKIVEPSPRDLDKGTTQGIYVVTPDGTLLHFFWTQLTTPRQMVDALKNALEEYIPTRVAAIPEGTRHWENLNRTHPKGGFVVRVSGMFPEVSPKRKLKEPNWRRKFGAAVERAIGRDVLWVRADENKALQQGQFPTSLLTRIVRYHLVDFVHGLEMRWQPEEILKMDSTFKGGKLQATIRLSTADGQRKYAADLIGYVKYRGDKITRFDLVSKGVFQTGWTKAKDPGEYPLEIAFSGATGAYPADRITPNNLRGKNPEYLR